MPEPKRTSYVRELRHDFRQRYGVAYDDVPLDEAIDLIAMLPSGSAYMRALDPHLGWGEQEKLAADIWDRLSELIRIYATGSTEGARMHERPGDLEDAMAELDRARAAKEKITSTKWEADDGSNR